MQVLTPTGYREVSTLSAGDEVSYFDAESGAPGVNHTESVQWVDADEWSRWHANSTLPPFVFYKINGTWTLNSEQSIWRNGTNVCHAKHLVVGDEIYDDADQPVTITSIEEVEADGWYRFDIDGDHSYIIDGLSVHNASRFWVGGTGNADGSTTTHIASSSGGAGGQSYPGSSDTLTFDGSSGAGTVTFTADHSLQSITCGAVGMTLDWSANNKNVTLSATSGFNGSGTGTRTINLGNGIWTIQGTSGNVWNFSTTTGLTFNANSSTITFSATTSSSRSLQTGNQTFSTVNIGANSSGGAFQIVIPASATIATLGITTPLFLVVTGAATLNITNAISVSGSSSSIGGIATSSHGSQATISSANNITLSWFGIREMAFSGGGTFSATNSLDLGHNSGMTITAPSTSGGVTVPAMMFGVESVGAN